MPNLIIMYHLEYHGLATQISEKFQKAGFAVELLSEQTKFIDDVRTPLKILVDLVYKSDIVIYLASPESVGSTMFEYISDLADLQSKFFVFSGIYKGHNMPSWFVLKNYPTVSSIGELLERVSP